MSRKTCHNCGGTYNNSYENCPSCDLPSATSVIVDQKRTYASSDYLEGFIYGFSDGLTRGIAVFWIGVILCFFGIQFVGFIFIGCAVVIGVVMPFVGASNFRSGQCPYCKINIKGIIKDNGITCKACKNRVISTDNTFRAI